MTKSLSPRGALELAALLAGIFLVLWLALDNRLSPVADFALPFKALAALLAGMMYASFLAAPFSVLTFFLLGQEGNPYLLALIGGIGAALGDILIVKVFRGVFKSLSFLSSNIFFEKLSVLSQKLHFPLFAFLLGMVVIASPFPDEIGLLLLGATSLPYWKLALLTYTLNTFGILAILLSANLVK